MSELEHYLDNQYNFILKRGETLDITAQDGEPVEIEYRDENDPGDFDPTKQWIIPASKFSNLCIKNGSDELGDNDDSVVIEFYFMENYTPPKPKVYKKE